MPLARTDRPLICRTCGAAHDDATATRGNRDKTAGPGDYVPCIGCGTVSVISDRHAVRQPTADEFDGFLADGHALAALLMLRRHIEGQAS